MVVDVAVVFVAAVLGTCGDDAAHDADDNVLDVTCAKSADVDMYEVSLP